jgi:hypothetical protein
MTLKSSDSVCCCKCRGLIVVCTCAHVFYAERYAELCLCMATSLLNASDAVPLHTPGICLCTWVSYKLPCTSFDSDSDSFS